MVKAEPELSRDGEYRKNLAKKGILRWDLKLTPNTINQDATVVSYSYSMEYDRNMTLQASRSTVRQ